MCWIHSFKRNIIRNIEFLKRWFSYYSVLKNCYDFDYSSILIIEQHQLKRVKDSIIKYKSHENWKRDVTHLTWAIDLLDIIIDEMPNDFYVNIRNAKRFHPYFDKLFNSSPTYARQDLYLLKAKSLYYKLREQYTSQWWD